MDVVVLDPLAYSLDTQQVLQALRVQEGSGREAEVRRLIAEAEAIAVPKAVYRLVFVEEKGPDYVVVDGRKLTSRILRVNLDGLQRAFAFVCTAGHELAAWMRDQEDFLARFYAEAIGEAILHSATTNLFRHLAETYALGQTAVMNPGSLADWPIGQQRLLFDLLGDVQAAIGVCLTPSMLMVPAKSVSGILFATQEGFASCQLCPREACPNRRMPYEPELFEQRYKTERG